MAINNNSVVLKRGDLYASLLLPMSIGRRAYTPLDFILMCKFIRI